MARTVYKSFLLWTRTLHIYATMLALVLLIFFSFTGFIMNHPGWFNIDKNVTVSDEPLPEPMPAKFLGTVKAAGAKDDEESMWAPRPTTKAVAVAAPTT